ncbi:unnamed protein product [Closterium sp. NIES-54]
MAHPTAPVSRRNPSSTQRILAAARWLAAAATLGALIWAVYAWTVALPAPVPADVAPPWSFSEERAMEHVRRLAAIGPHEFASPRLEQAMEVILETISDIRGSIPPCSADNTGTHTAPPSSAPPSSPSAPSAAAAAAACMDVEVQHAAAGWLPIAKGLTVGGGTMTIAYEHVRNVLVRVGVRPHLGQAGERGGPSAADDAGASGHDGAAAAAASAGAGESSADGRLFQRPSMLVSAHIDTVFTGPGVGDCSSNVAVMLELIRNMLLALAAGEEGAPGVERAGVQNNAVQNDVVFVLNSGEEEGLIGAHAFIAQVLALERHAWMMEGRIGGKGGGVVVRGDKQADGRGRRVVPASFPPLPPLPPLPSSFHPFIPSNTHTNPTIPTNPTTPIIHPSSSPHTQHPWAHSVRAFIDLEAMGIGGPSSVFQVSPPLPMLSYLNFCFTSPSFYASVSLPLPFMPLPLASTSCMCPCHPSLAPSLSHLPRPTSIFLPNPQLSSTFPFPPPPSLSHQPLSFTNTHRYLSPLHSSLSLPSPLISNQPSPPCMPNPGGSIGMATAHVPSICPSPTRHCLRPGASSCSHLPLLQCLFVFLTLNYSRLSDKLNRISPTRLPNMRCCNDLLRSS